jgi:phosphate transport system protein
MIGRHIVTSYDTELRNLRESISRMGETADTMTRDALASISTAHSALATAVIERDISRRQIEEHAVLLIVRRQPMAIVLRGIISAVRIVGDIERIGDLAKNIAKRVFAIREQPQPEAIAEGLQRLGSLMADQRRQALEAYATEDDEGAFRVWKSDTTVDTVYTSFFRDVLAFMIEHPQKSTAGTHLLFCVKNIERIGDHTTNIAETIHYAITGESLIDRPKQDNSYFAMLYKGE